jgi:hypothetical protein
MLKKIVLALAITAFASTSAFAAAKTPKTTPAAHKVAQAGEAKTAPVAAKKDKKVKKDAKVAAGPAAAPAAATPAAAPAAAPATK